MTRRPRIDSRRLLLVAALLAALGSQTACSPLDQVPGRAIFLHPDGMGANTWATTRLWAVGPDGRLAWDRLPRVAVYVGPTFDTVEQSSNAGATTHAYGMRVAVGDYGMRRGQPLVAASGQPLSLMREAQAAGKFVALFNSSSLTEPGTGAFLASVSGREDESAIAAQIFDARPDIALGGGEIFFLPQGVPGRHGLGVRADGRNLVEEARAAGYAVVFDADELAALPADARRVLGLFAAEETFNEGSEQALAEAGLPVFQPQAPRFDAMLAFILERARGAEAGYFIVGNEEGTDNLSGENNAPAVLEAALGADRALALALAEAERDPALTVVVASDSDNGGMNATSDDLDDPAELPRPLPSRTANGAPLDSDGGQPFLAAADRYGRRLPFYITWASDSDGAGGTLARAIGPGSPAIEGTIDASVVYRALHHGLFGPGLDARGPEQPR